ncbi:MAG: hypothetical protein V4459_15560 [Pseudomonadota bacterium]
MDQREDGNGDGAQGAVATLRLDHFTQRIGQAFAIDAVEGRIELTLTVAQELARSPREGGGFRLEFEGPPAPVLPQAIYSFALGSELHDIFIVPLGPGAAGKISYEAVFF